MKTRQPAYPLRLNKAIDRLLLVEALRRLTQAADFSEYTYYGLGGPYMEDFRIMYELCPHISMVSVEENPEIFKRQKRHIPCSSIELVPMSIGELLATRDLGVGKSVIWLDYIGLQFPAFEDFMVVLGSVAAGSIIKITLEAKPPGNVEERRDFTRRFDSVLPNPLRRIPRDKLEFSRLLPRMLRIAALKALPAAMGRTFLPVTSFTYADKARMYTLTGVVCEPEQQEAFRRRLRDWELARLAWEPPAQIDVPFLSTRERLELQEHLPRCRRRGAELVRALGYMVDDDRKLTLKAMKAYATYHRYYPFFVKAIP